MTALQECAAWHEGQAKTLRDFLALPMMLTESAVALRADIVLHDKFAVACREADGGEDTGDDSLYNVRRLRREIEELKRDKARLDWMDQSESVVFTERRTLQKDIQLRQAIDAAIAKAKTP